MPSPRRFERARSVRAFDRLATLMLLFAFAVIAAGALLARLGTARAV